MSEEMGMCCQPNNELLRRITVDPANCDGQPCIRGGPVRVRAIIDELNEGRCPAEILRALQSFDSSLILSDIEAAQAYVASAEDAINRHVPTLSTPPIYPMQCDLWKWVEQVPGEHQTTNTNIWQYDPETNTKLYYDRQGFAHKYERVRGTLNNDISDELLDLYASNWKPALGEILAEDDWNWHELRREARGQEGSFGLFSLEVDPQENPNKGLTARSLEGLMMVQWRDLKSNAPKTSWDTGQRPLLYVDRLAAAPWNRGQNVSPSPRKFVHVGSVLITHAVERSMANGMMGRIGLHALPGAVNWYRRTLRMREFHVDPNCENYVYFEFTPEGAALWLSLI